MAVEKFTAGAELHFNFDMNDENVKTFMTQYPPETYGGYAFWYENDNDDDLTIFAEYRAKYPETSNQPLEMVHYSVVIISSQNTTSTDNDPEIAEITEYDKAILEFAADNKHVVYVAAQ